MKYSQLYLIQPTYFILELGLSW